MSDHLKIADRDYAVASRALKSHGFKFNADSGIYERGDERVHLTMRRGKYRPIPWRRAGQRVADL